MKIAIVGAGISGLTAARKLNEDFDISVFEANSYVGGHTNTIDVEAKGKHFAVDTGFIVFNDATYPNFIELLSEIGVESQPTQMSFSVHCERTGFEYRGVDFKGLFAQRRNILNPKFYQMLFDFFRFNKRAKVILDSEDDSQTIGQFFSENRFSDYFVEKYFIPMGSAVWSCPPEKFRNFPIRFIVEFYKNHGMLAAYERPSWMVIRGGSREYIKPLTATFRDKIQTESAVRSIRRTANGVKLETAGGVVQEFDHVVLACHSDQALGMLDEPSQLEQEILAQFPYEKNEAVLHTDTKMLPDRTGAWASWNYRIREQDLNSNSPSKATVTYNMNILQGLDAEETFCVTLNDTERIDPGKIIRKIQYAHPIFRTGRSALQARHNELIDQNRTSYCGAYWANGFHEDGVTSALAVVNRLREKYIGKSQEVDSATSSV